MSINQLDSKKQFLILLMVVLLLMGLYIKFRLVSAIDGVSALNKQLNADQTLLTNPNVPEEPLEDIERLEDEVQAINDGLEELTAQASNLAQNLPDINNSQEVLLKISDLARASRVRIVSNVPFLVKRRVALGTTGSAVSSKKTLSPAEQRRQDRAARKAAQRAQRQAARTGAASGVGVYTQEGELMDKLVNGFDEPRPLHQVKIEGTYHSIKTFIEGLQGLPWQITVVKINYQLLTQTATQGFPQPLVVEMIIGT